MTLKRTMSQVVRRRHIRVSIEGAPRNVPKKELTLMRRRALIAGLLLGISLSILGASAPASGALRIDSGADLQADAETVRHIEELFNRAEDAIREKDLDVLMTVYSEHYRYQELKKANLTTIWTGFFNRDDQLESRHACSHSGVEPGNQPENEITCTGALWATSDLTGQRVNLSIWAGDVHHLIDEKGVGTIVGQGRQAPNRPEFGEAPPPLF